MQEGGTWAQAGSCSALFMSAKVFPFGKFPIAKQSSCTAGIHNLGFSLQIPHFLSFPFPSLHILLADAHAEPANTAEESGIEHLKGSGKKVETLKRLSDCFVDAMLPDECHFHEYISVHIGYCALVHKPFYLDEIKVDK